MSEYNGQMNPNDEELLKQYDLMSIYRFVNSENLSAESQKIVDLFNHYYLGKSQEEKEQ